MNIALASTIAVPMAYGGMDRLHEGLLAALREHGHEARLVGLEVDERDENGILRGYYDFYRLNLKDYDLAISAKAPAFMIRHPAHVPYLPHRMRVFYDLYEPRGAAFANLRRMIHWMDAWALSPQRTPEVFTIGRTVSDRLLRWGGVPSTPLRTPTTFRPDPPEPGQFLLSVGRLHSWKRVGLAIRALRRSRADLPLVIAGTGPQEAELRALAESDARIRFAGLVDEATLRRLYAQALAVVFPPRNEDLGLITLEAFAASKPVLTTDDAGEPALIVEEGKTGWIVDPTPEALAARMEWIAGHRSEVEAMGDACRAAAAEVTWDRVAEGLLAAGQRRMDQAARPAPVLAPEAMEAAAEGAGTRHAHAPARRIQLLVTDNQILDPPVGGGRIRIWELYRNLPDAFVTTYVGTHDHPGPRARDRWLAPNLREVIMPLTAVHFKRHEIWRRLTGGDATIDVTIPLLLGRCSPRYHRLLAEHLDKADILVTAHPWMTPFLPARPGLPLIYDSQNCEAAVKGPLLSRTLAGRYLARRVAAVERLAVERADLTLACSQADADQFVRRYGAKPERIALAPNGVDCRRVAPSAPGDGQALRRQFGLPAGPVAVFVGSDYEPNLETVDFLAQAVAPACPGVTFAIVGGVGEAWRRRRKAAPENLRLIGPVDDAGLLACYHGADLAVNPMRLGSGTNIKMLDYMAAGLPVVATLEGARGLAGRGGEHWLEARREDFVAAIGALLADAGLARALGEAARSLATTAYDWPAIAANYAQALHALLERQARSTQTDSAPASVLG
jgi:glycosyltransferase involved in cell wall biosynthesis